jgi:uncharacterized protein (DUF952 family)
VTHLKNPIAYHLVPAETWEAALAAEPFRAASLAEEGFVHLTHRMVDLVEVANAFYRADARPHVVLTIALRWLKSPWRYDGDDRYPHVYGPLDRDAITEVRPIERAADGAFLPIERPDVRRPPDMLVLLERLAAREVRFIVVGSSGAALLGADVVPGDLDVCPAGDPANLSRLAAVITDLGARPRVAVPGWVTLEEAAAYVAEPTDTSLDYLFETPFGDLDIVLGALGPAETDRFDYDDLVSRAVRVDVGGRPIDVASPADLLASKAGAGRPKDIRARAELERWVRGTPA